MDTEGGKVRVLVVDDEKVVADSYVMILEFEKYEARAAYSAEEAVAVLPSFQPQIVVSDIVMGAMSGFDLAIYLAEHHPACRVILMSGYAYHEPEVARSIKHGFDFLTKPVQPAELLGRLSTISEPRPNQPGAGVPRRG